MDIFEGIPETYPSGEVSVLAQFARRDTEDGRSPDWGEPKKVTLRILRRTCTVKKGKKICPAGQLLTINVVDFPWAEYIEDDYENQEFLAENYRMKVIEIL
jgi:hypothetical protein